MLVTVDADGCVETARHEIRSAVSISLKNNPPNAQVEKERRAKLSELRRQAADATAAHADRIARLTAARQQQETMAAERQVG